ncbi:hypothetical protein BH10CYA1_BH10CYA1_49800 [soil metagenome]
MLRNNKILIEALVCSSTLSMAVNIAQASELSNRDGTTRIKPTGFVAAKASSPSRRGEAIFQKGVCTQCHSIGGAGGCLGPILAGVGGRRSTTFITDRITAGGAEEEEFRKLYGRSELMPHPRLPRAQAKLVVAYLITLPEPKAGFVIKGHSNVSGQSKKNESALNGDSGENSRSDSSTVSTESIQVGKKLFYSSGCMSCHSIGKVGGQFATPLDDVGSLRGRNYISNQMKGAELLTLGTNDEYGERGTEMPPSNLTPSQITSITDYLMSISPIKSK